ncbi:hypothetical protein QJS66_15100 [Kocuria rhizophila]|nr:hypothetical protein QJS66_15100 [Kocuria rhizophila]
MAGLVTLDHRSWGVSRTGWAAARSCWWPLWWGCWPYRCSWTRGRPHGGHPDRGCAGGAGADHGAVLRAHAALLSMFPTAIRTTGMSIAYNVGVYRVRGFAPLVLAWLISATGSRPPRASTYAAAAALSLVSVLIVRRRYGVR